MWVLGVILLSLGSFGQENYDFTKFEILYSEWESQFRSGPDGGHFSYLPGSGAVDIYGTTDMLISRYIVDQLDLSKQEVSEWTQTINSFQNGSGFYIPQPYEYSCGYIPWHTSAYAVAALYLIGQAPQERLSWAMDIAANQSLWYPTFDPELYDTKQAHGIWESSHKIAAVPAVLLMNGTRDTFADFFSWWYDWLSKNVDQDTGYWGYNATWYPPQHYAMAGAFHMFYVYTFDNQHPWLLPSKVFQATLDLQHKNGLWDQNVTYCVDMDGLYEVTRTSIALGNWNWNDVRNMCRKYLSTASEILNDREKLFWNYDNSHRLPGALDAVAECSKWFPDMVVTKKKWRMSVDVACYI